MGKVGKGERRTKTGKVLTLMDLEKLAEEAERGYCIEWSKKGTGYGMCGRPLVNGKCDRPSRHREAP
jgi:hypothetical protein